MNNLHAKVIKVIEVLNFELQKMLSRNYWDSKDLNEMDISISQEDLNRAGMDIYSFSTGLQYLHDQGNIMINNICDPLEMADAPDDIYEELTRYIFDIKVPPSVLPLLEEYKDGLKGEPNMSLRFNEFASTLYIKGYQIKINRQNKENMQHKILKYIFVNNKDNLSIKFNYSDLAFWNNDIDFDDVDGWKRYYRPCEQINEKIRKDTNNEITDFLDFNTGSAGYVIIKEKFLKSS